MQKCFKIRMAAWLRPDPLTGLMRSLRHPSRNWDPTSKGREGMGWA